MIFFVKKMHYLLYYYAQHKNTRLWRLWLPLEAITVRINRLQVCQNWVNLTANDYNIQIGKQFMGGMTCILLDNETDRS